LRSDHSVQLDQLADDATAVRKSSREPGTSRADVLCEGKGFFSSLKPEKPESGLMCPVRQLLGSRQLPLDELQPPVAPVHKM
jgi:hypothetical protein